jgi:hypothetical protein
MFGTFAQSSPQEILTAMAWILAIAVWAIVYYRSKNVHEVLLYSGIVASVCAVILLTGQPPLPEAVYKAFSQLGILPPVILLAIFAIIIGREVVLRLGPRIQNTSGIYQNWTYFGGTFQGVFYHGTPQIENAIDILHNGFIIGPGNSRGTGLYLGDLDLAMEYVGGTGSIIKIQLEAPFHQIADHSTVVNSVEFQNWSLTFGDGNEGDDITKYTLEVLRKRFLKVNDNFYVALADRTNENERIIFEGLTVLSILDAQGNPM